MPKKGCDLNPDMKVRIRERQKSLGYSEKEVAWRADMSASTYHNIVRLEHGTHSISQKNLDALASVLGCTVDYLQLKSDDPKVHEDGTPLNRILTFEPRDQMLEAITRYLQDDIHTLNSIYFLLFYLPERTRTALINALNCYLDTIRTSSFLGCADKYTPEQINILENCFEFDDPAYIDALLQLSNANKAASQHRWKNALLHYLTILQITSEESIRAMPLAHKAVEMIRIIRKEWTNFPLPPQAENTLPQTTAEQNAVVDELLQQYESNNFLSSEQKKMLNGWIYSLKPEDQP